MQFNLAEWFVNDLAIAPNDNRIAGSLMVCNDLSHSFFKRFFSQFF